MGYLPYRDNPELTEIPLDVKNKIGHLLDDLEQTSQQHQHEDRCGCDPGRKNFWECIYGPLFPPADADELLALAYARGLLKFPE